MNTAKDLLARPLRVIRFSDRDGEVFVRNQIALRSLRAMGFSFLAAFTPEYAAWEFGGRLGIDGDLYVVTEAMDVVRIRAMAVHEPFYGPMRLEFNRVVD